MGVRVASWNLLLPLLILLICQCVESRDMIEEHPIANNILQLPSSNVGKFEGHDHFSAQKNIQYDSKQQHDHQKTSKLEKFHAHDNRISHMDHMDYTNVMIFFTMNDLKVGKTMPIYFPKKDIATSPHLLPRDEADTIPFSSKELPSLLKFFSFSRDSPQGRAMEETLRQCEIQPIKGETKTCATSLESMLDFARGAFGLDEKFSVVTTTFLINSSTTFQNYTVLDVPKEILARKMVACHTMPYPYAVFYCHYQESENKVYKILLGGENGDVVEAVAVCHMDTSQWSRNHVSFRVLGIEPGTMPVCHFFPAENLVWIPTPTSIQ